MTSFDVWLHVSIPSSLILPVLVCFNKIFKLRTGTEKSSFCNCDWISELFCTVRTPVISTVCKMKPLAVLSLLWTGGRAVELLGAGEGPGSCAASPFRGRHLLFVFNCEQLKFL